MVRTIVATAGCARFGTRLRRLVMKWVRQRCQEAPAKTVAIASLSPRWASEVTSCTPPRPPHLLGQRVQPEVDVGTAIQRAAQKRLHHGVQLLTDARDLALGDTVTAERLHQVVNP